jgi:hypothetical protein
VGIFDPAYKKIIDRGSPAFRKSVPAWADEAEEAVVQHDPLSPDVYRTAIVGLVALSFISCGDPGWSPSANQYVQRSVNSAMWVLKGHYGDMARGVAGRIVDRLSDLANSLPCEERSAGWSLDSTYLGILHRSPEEFRRLIQLAWGPIEATTIAATSMGAPPSANVFRTAVVGMLAMRSMEDHLPGWDDPKTVTFVRDTTSGAFNSLGPMHGAYARETVAAAEQFFEGLLGGNSTAASGA